MNECRVTGPVIAMLFRIQVQYLLYTTITSILQVYDQISKNGSVVV